MVATSTSSGGRAKPRRLRRLLKWPLRSALALAALALLYGLGAFVLPRIPVNGDWKPPEQGVDVWVETNGVHTDFVVPVRTQAIDWTQTVPREAFDEVDAGVQWVAIGWGDRGFYLEVPDWDHLSLRVAVTATFGLGSAAMHVTYMRWPPDEQYARRVTLTEPQYRDLVDFLSASFARDAAGRARVIDHPGYTKRDRFFEATGTYSLFRTCNSWTGEGLARAGVRTGLWTPFADDVMRPLGK
jgi:uncharacterized protein (TIGR02117 family)